MERNQRQKKTLRYSEDFKSRAVRLSLEKGIQVQAVAKHLDIHPFMLSRWRKDYREGNLKMDKRTKVVSLKPDKQELTKIRKLEKENARLRQENDLLKKWQRFVAEQNLNGSGISTDTDQI